MDERSARVALACLVEPGTVRIAELVAAEGPVAVWEAARSGDLGPAYRTKAARLEPEEVAAEASRKGIRFVIPGDAEWVACLADLGVCETVQEMGGAPYGLWARGVASLAALADRSVSIVGSRASTPYGDIAAAELAADLAGRGVTVISGGAFGIDVAAHRGALAARGPTVSVMASGLDALYPPANRTLLERIAEEGLLLSELPPGAHPTRMRFLARNRLIAALSKGTVLVEAAARSGARNTVTWANACCRPVMAIPGPVHSATSATPHRLIREGEAVLVTCAEDILELVGPLGRRAKARQPQQRPLDGLTRAQLRVYEALPARSSMDAGEISLRSGVPLGECLATLDRLTEDGWLIVTPIGWRLAPLSERAG